jgi:copper transport protein
VRSPVARTVVGLAALVPAEHTVGVVAGVARFVVYAGVLCLVGAMLFLAAVWPDGRHHRRLHPLLWWSWVAVALGSASGVGLHGASRGGLGLGDAADPSVIGDVLDTRFGAVSLARLILLVPIALLLLQVRRAGELWWRVLAVALGLSLVATPAFSGHADAGRWVGWARAFDIAHLASSAVWVGGLAVLLLVALRPDVSDARAVAARFSPIAFTAVAAVVLSGVFESVRQLRTLDAFETPYGRILTVKVVVALTLLGVASLTRSALHGRLLEPEDEPRTEADEVGVLRRLVGAEVALALAVLAVTALLVDASPGPEALPAGGPFDETHVVDDAQINVVAEPGTVGPTVFHLFVDDPAGGLTPPVGASGTLSLPSGGAGDIPVTFIDAGPGHWSAEGVDIPVAGRWQLTVDIQLTDVDTVSSTFTIPIGGSS